MKKIKVVLILFAIMVFIPTVYAGEAYVDRIDINAKVNFDGSMNVTETIYWDIEGNLNGVYREILIENPENKLNSARDIQVNSVKVNGKTFAYSRTQLSNGEDGKYNINTISGGKQIKIFTPSEQEEKITTISYTLYDVVVQYNDIAEIYWNFIGDGWSYGISKVNIYISLPSNSRTLKVFGHGPLNGYSQIIGDDEIYLTVEGLKSNEQIDARLLFDKSLIYTNKVVNEDKLQSILEEEAILTNKANTKRKIAKWAIGGSIGLIVISLLIY